MKTTFSLLFYLKKPKNYHNGPMPVYLRITVNGQRSETTAGRECEPAQWNSTAGRLKGTKEEVKSFNAYLDDLQTKFKVGADMAALREKYKVGAF